LPRVADDAVDHVTAADQDVRDNPEDDEAAH
jgi:hypothetical protein